MVFPGDAKDLKEVDPLEQLSKCKVPLLVIHNMEHFEPSAYGSHVD